MRLAGAGVCLMEGKREDHEDRAPVRILAHVKLGFDL